VDVELHGLGSDRRPRKSERKATEAPVGILRNRYGPARRHPRTGGAASQLADGGAPARRGPGGLPDDGHLLDPRREAGRGPVHLVGEDLGELVRVDLVDDLADRAEARGARLDDQEHLAVVADAPFQR
jgi:hypothetical protein